VKDNYAEAGLKIRDCEVKAVSATSSSPQNPIDNRDLADVYLSTSHNEPSSADIARVVKGFIVEGTLQPILSNAALTPGQPGASQAVASLALQDVELCQAIAPLSLDPDESRIW